ncbi:MAG TPA: Bax inhibitor-1/YccA family protein [Gemmatimonadaceae bacterium]|nr:Bax inhibitor-1/YccA family protein [Gemmatimonadaceae bacterium]
MGMSFRELTAAGVAAPVRTGAERVTLIRRTYLLVLASVLVTMAGVSFSISTPPVLAWSARHPIITFIGMFLPLIAAQRFRHVFPTNIGFVFLFTFLEGIFISPFIWMLGQTQPGVVGQAALLTGTTFGALTLYAFLSKKDFSAWGGFFIVGLWVLIATSLLNLFFQNTTASLWIAGATVFVFGGLLVFDTWRLRNVFGPNDYVQAAVAIYLDLLNMFLAILSLLGGRRE